MLMARRALTGLVILATIALAGQAFARVPPNGNRIIKPGAVTYGEARRAIANKLQLPGDCRKVQLREIKIGDNGEWSVTLHQKRTGKAVKTVGGNIALGLPGVDQSSALVKASGLGSDKTDWATAEKKLGPTATHQSISDLAYQNYERRLKKGEKAAKSEQWRSSNPVNVTVGQ